MELSGGDSATMSGVLAWLTVQSINIGVGIVVLLIGWWLAGRVRKLMVHWMERSSRLDPIVESFLGSLIYYALLLVVVIAGLNLMGVQTASLIAVLGAASLAIGLALQGSLTSLAAGVLIIVMRPFKIGDYIEVSGHTGTVKAINLFLTELTTYDNIQKLLPNSAVWGATVTNYTSYATRMLDVEVAITYGDDIGTAISTLRRLGETHDAVLSDPAPDAFVSGLAESAVNVTMRVWVPNTDYWPLRRELTKRAKEEIQTAGLTIALPHRAILVSHTTGPEAGSASDWTTA